MHPSTLPLYSPTPTPTPTYTQLPNQNNPALDQDLQNLDLEDNEQEQNQPFYLQRIAHALIMEEGSTLFVDYRHLQSFDAELAGALESNYYRCEVCINKYIYMCVYCVVRYVIDRWE
jgi:hypothetical protein